MLRGRAMSCAEQRLVFVGAGEIEGKYWDRLIIVEMGAPR